MLIITSIFSFLLRLIFDSAIFLLWIRLASAYFNLPKHHPIVYLVHKLTDQLLSPLIGVSVPSHFKKYASLIMLVVFGVEIFKYISLGLLLIGGLLPLPALIAMSIGDFMLQPLNALFYMIILRAIMSWVAPNGYNPILQFIAIVTEPFLAWGRKIIPNISGFDFSPILLLVLIEILYIIIRGSLPIL